MAGDRNLLFKSMTISYLAIYKSIIQLVTARRVMDYLISGEIRSLILRRKKKIKCQQDQIFFCEILLVIR